MNIFSSTAASGLRHFSDRLQGSANNVANVATDGFKSVKVNGQTVQGGGVASVVSRDQSPGMFAFDSAGEMRELSNTDLEREVVTQVAAGAAYAANLATLRAEEATVGSLFDRKA